jgi:hypothetical protein
MDAMSGSLPNMRTDGHPNTSTQASSSLSLIFFVLHILRDDTMNDPNSLPAQLRRITPRRFVAYLGCSHSTAFCYHLLIVIRYLPALAVLMPFILGYVFWFIGEYNIDMQVSYCLTLSIIA